MTPQEKKLFAALITLFGVVREQVPEYAATKPPAERRKIEYAAEKFERAALGLFKAIYYERTEQEKAQLQEFVIRSKFYVLGPQDSETAQRLEAEERAWLEAAD